MRKRKVSNWFCIGLILLLLLSETLGAAPDSQAEGLAELYAVENDDVSDGMAEAKPGFPVPEGAEEQKDREEEEESAEEEGGECTRPESVGNEGEQNCLEDCEAGDEEVKEGGEPGTFAEEEEPSARDETRCPEKEGDRAAERTSESFPETPAGAVESGVEPIPAGSLLPADRVTQGDLNRILGAGVDEEIADDVDAVAELRRICPDDEGLLQMAAQAAGKTEETAEEAAAAQLRGEVLEEDTELALEHAGLLSAEIQDAPEPVLAAVWDNLFCREVSAAEDRRSGRSLPFEPAGSEEDAMVRLSSFALVRKKDGAGDWDHPSSYIQEGEGYDWAGNDSSDANGVVRTNDDVTYVFAYSTALSDAYIYNTISGTRIYVAYRLPVGPEQAVFNTEAMPWLKGDGPDGSPIVTADPDGSQLLIGFRELPDTEDEEGCYDVPGAGTLNCVISVRYMTSRSVLKPEFYAWIEQTGDQSRIPAEARHCNSEHLPAEVSVTCGACVGVSFEKSLDAAFTAFGDGGRIKVFDYRITAGKPNGSLKGADIIDASVPMKVYIRGEARATTGYETGLEILDYATCSMKRLPDNPENYELACFFSGNSYMQDNGNAVKNKVSDEMNGSCGEIADAGTEGELSWFTVSDFAETMPGEILSEGCIVVRQKEPEYGPSTVHFWATLRAERVRAASASGEGDFSQLYYTESGELRFPEWTIENTIDPPGNWDAHLLLTEGKTWSRTINLITDSEFSTSGVTGFGSEFGIFINQHYTPGSASSPAERSKEWYVLWDNTKMELAVDAEHLRPSATNDSPAGLGGERPIYNNTGGSAVNQPDGSLCSRLLYITKVDGSAWNSDEEMLAADLRSYDQLRFWPSYAEAVAGGKKICGVLCEEWNLTEPAGTVTYDALSLHMKTTDREEIIGTSAMVCYAMVTYTSDIKQTSSCGAAGTGMGEFTSEEEFRNHTVKRWNMQVPRTYRKTGRTEGGLEDPSTLTAHNTIHEGSTLYITGYRLGIRDTVGDGLEAMTLDLSEARRLRFTISADFRPGSHAAGVSAVIYTPDPKTEAGESPVELQSISACAPDGTATVLEEGRIYEVAEFVPGAPGSFVMERGDLGEVYNGGSLTGDSLDGKILRLRQRETDDLMLGYAGSGTEAVLFSRQTPEEHCRWRLKKMQGSIYRIVHVSSGAVLCAGAAQDAEGAKVQVKKTSSDDRTSWWFVKSAPDGSLCLEPFSAVGRQLVSETTGEGSAAVLRSGDGSIWLPEPEGTDAVGTKLTFSGLSSVYALPSFIKEYRLDKTRITEETTLRDEAVISGDGLTAVQSEANLHLSSSSVGFTETKASVLKMEVDKEDAEDGSVLTYTIRYTNQYDDGHRLHLADVLPSSEEFVLREGTPVVRPTDLEDGILEDRDQYGSDEEFERAKRAWAEHVLTMTGERAQLTFVPGSLRVETSEGSEVRAELEGDILRAEGSLKSGEQVTISYGLLLEGTEKGDLIRNSCVQEDDFGTVYSNRVETVIAGLPAERGPVMTLTAGGRGNRSTLFFGAVLLMLSLFLIPGGQKKNIG